MQNNKSISPSLSQALTLITTLVALTLYAMVFTGDRLMTGNKTNDILDTGGWNKEVRNLSLVWLQDLICCTCPNRVLGFLPSDKCHLLTCLSNCPDNMFTVE